MSEGSIPLVDLRADLNNLAQATTNLNPDQQLPPALADRWQTILAALPDTLQEAANG